MQDLGQSLTPQPQDLIRRVVADVGGVASGITAFKVRNDGSCGGLSLVKLLQEFFRSRQRFFDSWQAHVPHPVFVGRQFLVVLEFTDKQRPKSLPVCMLAALQILLRFSNGLFDELDPFNRRCFLHVQPERHGFWI